MLPDDTDNAQGRERYAAYVRPGVAGWHETALVGALCARSA
ncbi:hypothetical protein [Streptomyces sp. NPDC001980]